MAKIPVGNFGYGVPRAPDSRLPVSAGGEYLAQGLNAAANTAKNIVMQQAQQEGIANRKAESEAKQKLEESDRFASMEILSNYGRQDSDLGNTYRQKIVTGMDPKLADDMYQAETDQAWSSIAENVPASQKESAHAAYVRSKDQTRASFMPVVQKAEINNKAVALDKIQQDTLNDSDPSRSLAIYKTALANSGLSPADQSLKEQEWKNAKTLTTVKLQISDAEDQPTLEKIDTFLKDEKQAAHLTVEQRTALQVEINGKKQRLDQSAKVETDKHERVALQTFNNISNQVQTGGLISSDVLLDAANTFKGTQFEGKEQLLLQNYNSIQQFRQQPLSVQSQQLQQMKQKALSTETKNPKDFQQWMDVYQNVYDKNTKQAKTAPLEYYTSITGNVKPPIDFSVLLQPDGQQKLTATLNDRMATISAMQKRDGYIVAANPFYPQEVASIKQFLAGAGDDLKLSIMSTVAKAAQVGDHYDNALLTGAINAIADDSQALRLAGFAQAKDLKSSYGANVANLVLAGDRIRKEKTVTLPSDQIMQQEFNLAVAGAVPVGSQMHTDMLRMTQYIYAGLTARDGKIEQSKDILDDDLFKTSLSLATGGITEHGGGKIIKPYGMKDNIFDEKLQAALITQASSAGLDYRDFDDTPLVPIMNGSEGQYYISDGRGGVVVNPNTKRPLMIEVAK